MHMQILVRVAGFTMVAAAILVGVAHAQTRENGPWWPSPHGPKDQAGNSNYVTPEKILKALRLAKTGQTYELGRIYEAEMPQYGYRPYFLSIIPPAQPFKDGMGVVHADYFTGFIGQMGTQFDAFGHQGRVVRMADGTLKGVYYNGFTEEELIGANRGVGGLQALGVEHVKPIITRGILIDIAAFKGVPVLESRYEVTLADVRGALAKQGIREDSIEPGDAVLFNYGWGVNWNNPREVQRRAVLCRREPGVAWHRRRSRPMGRREEGVDGGRRQLLRDDPAADSARAGQRASRAVLRRRDDAGEHGPARARARPRVRIPLRERDRAHQGRDGLARAASRDSVMFSSPGTACLAFDTSFSVPTAIQSYRSSGDAAPSRHGHRIRR